MRSSNAAPSWTAEQYNLSLERGSGGYAEGKSIRECDLKCQPLPKLWRIY